jgi:hypothetical protein
MVKLSLTSKTVVFYIFSFFSFHFFGSIKGGAQAYTAGKNFAYSWILTLGNDKLE